MPTHSNWPTVFDLFVRDLGAAPPSRDERGVQSIQLRDAAIAAGPLLELLPGRWDRWPGDPRALPIGETWSTWVSVSELAVAWLTRPARGLLSARIAVAPTSASFLELLNSFEMSPPPAWSVAFGYLVDELRIDPPSRDEDGAWYVGLVGSGTPERVVELLPGEWSLAGLDESSEQTSALFVSESERAIVSCCDHFQAGLFGDVTVYPNAVTFKRAEAAAVARFVAKPWHEEDDG